MKKSILIFLSVLSLNSFAQDTTYQNTATKLINADNRLTIRGYSEFNYNQPINRDTRNNGTLDIKRMVLFAGYKFNPKTSFVTEIEIEHASEIYLEQAFVDHRLHKNVHLRAGLILIPMGIVNEYHEPTTFNGVERPNIDKYIIPTTWREVGAGFQGLVPRANISYQIYMVNGFKGYDGTKGLITETAGLRGGRQKGIQSTMSSPNLSAKVDFFGLRNLKVGMSAYMGNTQSPLYHGIDRNSDSSMRLADSSVIGIQMFGIDARYAYKNLRLRGQAIVGQFNNTDQYNAFTGSKLSNSINGFYLEAAYNILPVKNQYQLYPFVRFEQYNTQAKASEALNTDLSKHQDITAGLSFFLHPGVVLKADYQNFKVADNSRNQINLGVGIWF